MFHSEIHADHDDVRYRPVVVVVVVFDRRQLNPIIEILDVFVGILFMDKL